MMFTYKEISIWTCLPKISETIFETNLFDVYVFFLVQSMFHPLTWRTWGSWHYCNVVHLYLQSIKTNLHEFPNCSNHGWKEWCFMSESLRIVRDIFLFVHILHIFLSIICLCDICCSEWDEVWEQLPVILLQTDAQILYKRFQMNSCSSPMALATLCTGSTLAHCAIFFISRLNMHGREPISEDMGMYGAHGDSYQGSPRKCEACWSVCFVIQKLLSWLYM